MALTDGFKRAFHLPFGRNVERDVDAELAFHISEHARRLVAQRMVFEVNVRDPLVYVTLAGVLGAVTVAAAAVPARRATRVEPLDALRAQ